ncbi:hypothetical protein PG984_007734 [Apiospora sp. TS-2023a]
MASTTTTAALLNEPAIATKTAASVPTNTHVSFWYQFLEPSAHVFVVPPGQTPKTPQVGWNFTNETLDIRKASLFMVDDDNNSEPIVIATHTPTTKVYRVGPVEPTRTADSTSNGNGAGIPTPGSIFWEQPLKKREEPLPKPADLPFDVEGGLGSVTIKPADYQPFNANQKKLYLTLEWHDKQTQTDGSSSTTLFTTSDEIPGADTPSLNSLLQDLAKNYPNPNIGYQPESPINQPGSAITTAPAQSSSMAPSTSATSNSSDGNNGLNGGAIAGIVIGSVIGVLLIIALAYFLCIRRRADGKQRNRHIHGDVGYASDSGAAAMMMREKDISGVNHSSPQSAFADDGGRLHDRGGVAHENESINYSSTPPYQEGRGPVAGIGAHPQRSTDSLPQNDYSPYNNGNGDQGSSIHRPQSYAADSAIGVAVTGGAGSAPNAERERNGSVGGGTVGRTSHHTSRPGSEVRSPSRYAHLIEEGMTEEEIWRLEDEERQLDAAIEDAGEAW